MKHIALLTEEILKEYFLLYKDKRSNISDYFFISYLFLNKKLFLLKEDKKDKILKNIDLLSNIFPKDKSKEVINDIAEELGISFDDIIHFMFIELDIADYIDAQSRFILSDKFYINKKGINFINQLKIN